MSFTVDELEIIVHYKCKNSHGAFSSNHLTTEKTKLIRYKI